MKKYSMPQIVCTPFSNERVVTESSEAPEKTNLNAWLSSRGVGESVESVLSWKE